MEVGSIRDRDGFRAWLNSQPRETSIVLGYRASLRVAPVFWRTVQPAVASRKTTALPLLHLLLGNGIAIRSKDPEFCFAANTMSGQTVLAHELDEQATSALDAGEEAYAADSFVDHIHYIWSAVDAADYAAGELSPKFWKELWADAEATLSGATATQLLETALWNGSGNPFFEDWLLIRDRWVGDSRSWQFWVDWYDGALAGETPDWDLLKDVALLPDELWEGDPEGLNAAIAEIVETHKKIDRIEADTPNGEHICLDGSTGLLTSDPVPGLDGDHAQHIVDRVLKAIDRFEDACSSGASNLGPVLRDCAGQDLEYLRDDLEDNRSYDLGLHDVIEDCLVSVRGKFDRERIADDPNATRLVRVLERATVDIYASSPSAREVLERRGEEYYRRIKLEQHLQFNDLCMSMAQQSDAPLRKAMERDVQLADDETASEAVRRRARYNTISRLPRGARAVHYSRFKDGEKVVPDQPQPDRTWVKVVLGQAGIEILKWYLQG